MVGTTLGVYRIDEEIGRVSEIPGVAAAERLRTDLMLAGIRPC